MKKYVTYLQLVTVIISLDHFTASFAANLATQPKNSFVLEKQTVASERVEFENRVPNFFGITFYKPTYILPFYYTGSPDTKVYRNNTPGNEKIKSTEFKYQLSFKVPIWKNILKSNSSLFLAYTQLSYWQAYNRIAFFRETDYEPELFLANEMNIHVFKNWHLNLLNLGVIHQSNGFGNRLERTWNRIYLEAVSSSDCWMVSLKPWIIIHDPGMRQHNPDIGNYLGYGQLLVAYKFYDHVFSLQAHNLIEGGARRATAEFNWSFPLTNYLYGYVQLFSGYGQSLIEYNHRTNSAGVGIALSNWV